MIGSNPQQNLEGLRKQLLSPRAITRDEDGWLAHPAIPICDEGVRYDDLLAVFGVQISIVSMENQAPELADRYFEDGAQGCADWNPVPPQGEGWLLLEIYDTEEGPHALYGRGCPQMQWPRRGGPLLDFYAHLARQEKWSRKTFGPGTRTRGICDHIRKELLEIEDDPRDLEEWIDVVMLALDGAWRTGATPTEIIRALGAKQTKNEGRNWPDWRSADPNKAIEHVKS